MAQNVAEITFLDRLTRALTAHLGGDAGSPTKIGRLLDVNKQTVARWLDGGMPTPDMLFRIADKTNVNARWLALGEGSMEREPDLTAREVETIQQIYRVLQRNPKMLEKWLRDGRELVEIAATVRTP